MRTNATLCFFFFIIVGVAATFSSYQLKSILAFHDSRALHILTDRYVDEESTQWNQPRIQKRAVPEPIPKQIRQTKDSDLFVPNICSGYGHPNYTGENNDCGQCKTTKYNCSGDECSIQQITCNSQIYNFDDALPVKMICKKKDTKPSQSNLKNCTVAQILYQGVIIDFTKNSSQCTVDKLYCQNKEVKDSFENVKSQNCSIKQAPCKEQEMCSSIIKLCSGSSCSYQRYPCQSGCLLQDCVCPVDRTGTQCEVLRPYKCQQVLTSSTNCSLPSGGGSCRIPDFDENFSFSVRYDCRFLIPPPEKTSQNFNYVFQKEDMSFARSKPLMNAPKYLTFQTGEEGSLKVNLVNFYTFSDARGHQVLPITTSNLVGNPLSIHLNLTEIYHFGREFFAGGRLLIELIPSGIKGLPPTHWVYLDIAALPPPPQSSVWSLTAVMSLVFLIVLILILAFAKCRKEGYFGSGDLFRELSHILHSRQNDRLN